MPTRRQERVCELIHQEISNLLQKKMADPRLARATVLAVEITPDLKSARVFISAFGDLEARQQSLEGLEHASGYIRRELAHRLQLRYAPELHFFLDDSWQHGARIDELLERLKKDGSD
jgi:ribosome-binding factor A